MIKDKLILWHEIVRNRDWDGLNNLLSEQVEFHSPFVWKPKMGREITSFILRSVLEITNEFTYHREWVNEYDMALEFAANIGDLKIKGIDLIKFNEDGQIVHFEVMIRPGNGLMAIGQAMSARLEAAGLS